MRRNKQLCTDHDWCTLKTVISIAAFNIFTIKRNPNSRRKIAEWRHTLSSFNATLYLCCEQFSTQVRTSVDIICKQIWQKVFFYGYLVVIHDFHCYYYDKRLLGLAEKLDNIKSTARSGQKRLKSRFEIVGLFGSVKSRVSVESIQRSEVE